MSHSDKIQTLMDEVYDEWRKEENTGEGKWDVLSRFSEAHQIAVVFGNFNYQVGNGGISQWIFNGYFHDDAEKFSEFLELGADLDERFQTILDKIYELDQFAQEIGCDRDGYYIDQNDYDSESQFIGDIINCSEFDTWYYDNCDKDDWWKIVCVLMEKKTPLNIKNTQHDTQTPESNATIPPFRVYVENRHIPSLGGFTISLPTTPSKLQLFLNEIITVDSNELIIINIKSEIYKLDIRLNGAIARDAAFSSTFNELNYLASRINNLSNNDLEVFTACIEAGRNCETITDMINLTHSENLQLFELQPAFSPEMYGEFLIDCFFPDVHADAFDRLKASPDEKNQELATYIELLETHINRDKIALTIIEQENGVFTEQGYLTGGDQGLLSVYQGVHCISPEHIVCDSPTALAVMDTKELNTTPDNQKSVLAHITKCNEAKQAIQDNVKRIDKKHTNNAPEL